MSQSLSKITKLTQTQEALLVDFRERWQQIVLSTAPADRVLAEQGIVHAYHNAGFKKPTIVWCQSPLSMSLVVCFLSELSRRPAEVVLTSELWKRLRELVGKPVIEDIRQSIASLHLEPPLKAFERAVRGVDQGEFAWEFKFILGKSIYNEIFRPTMGSVWTAFRSRFGEDVRMQISRELIGDDRFQEDSGRIFNQIMLSINRLMGELGQGDGGWNIDLYEQAKLRDKREKLYKKALGRIPETPVDPHQACRSFLDSVWRFVGDDRRVFLGDYGVFRVGTLALWDYCREVFDFQEETRDLEGLLQMARSANSWCLPYQSYCFICDRPTALFVDNSKTRLHNPAGPAIKFSNGWSLHAWNGVAVPEFVITDPHAITVREINEENNIEVRRVMIERMGLERFLTESGANEIDSDQFGVLYRREMWGDEPIVTVVVTNKTAEPDGTFKKYFLRVPPAVTSAKEAVAWTFGMATQEYFPKLET